MAGNISAVELKREIERILPERLGKIYDSYFCSIEELLTPLKWKPIVLVIGNYSSGKSTFINEFLGMDIQRTGQAPTDDSFTIITAPEAGEAPGDLTGNSIVSDERLPFGCLRRFGEKLLAHLVMKKVDVEHLADIAIIDTPGMLDSVTEKDRGYDYLGVIGELAKIADLIVLMFDPHKAGTIKETYQVIRITLPATTGEDRVAFVMNRVDECANLEDLVRAYGTLCWNLSQMTGRKDIPRIYLTYAKIPGRKIPQGFEIWDKEREELKKAFLDAPRMRLFHMLQEVDKSVRELSLIIKAMDGFKSIFTKKLKGFGKAVGISALLAFILGDLVMNLFLGYPSDPLVVSTVSGNFSIDTLLWPIIWLLLVVGMGSVYFQKITFPNLVKNFSENPDDLVKLEDAFERDLWHRVKGKVSELIEKNARQQVWLRHKKNLKKAQNFLKRDLQEFFEKISRF